jgi:hypothetical protein
MRADSITLLLAGGLLAFAGCGGGGGAAPGSPNQPLDNGAYQKPPSTYQKPPSTTDKVSDYQSATGSDVCDAICGFYEVAQCLTDGDGNGEGGQGNGGGQTISLAECKAGCDQAIASYPCKQELVTAIDCLLGTIDLTCELLQHAQDGDISGMDVQQLQVCQSAVDAYTSCQEGVDGPDEMHCTPPNDCGGCAGSCERCLCQYIDDPSMCTRLCANQN